ncbi:transporter [Halostagnicola bangensis]
MVVTDYLRMSIVVGALAGVAAWILGYLVTYAGAIGDIRADEQAELLELAAEESIEFEMVGLLFYNAHNVAAEVPQYSVFQALERSHNFVLADGGSSLFLYLVPVLVLLLAGGAVASYTVSDLEVSTDAALAGGMVVLGYFPLVVIGLFVFSIDLGDGAMRPEPLFATALAGLAYPLVFGSIGGVLAGFASSRSE